MSPPYPPWICESCGRAQGNRLGEHTATFHTPDPDDPNDKCGWCGSTTQLLTEPRDYGYPPAPGQDQARRKP